jgi:hypothetical protein
MGRHPKVCGRNPDAGPGSCWWWWESCPEKVTGCAIRAQRTALAGLAEASGAILIMAEEALTEARA